MKNKILTALLIAFVAALQSCAVAGGIFKAGTAVGIIAVVVVLAVIIFVLSLIFKK